MWLLSTVAWMIHKKVRVVTFKVVQVMILGKVVDGGKPFHLLYTIPYDLYYLDNNA